MKQACVWPPAAPASMASVGGTECGLRDTKDSRFGMGLGSIHLSTPERHDRLWLLNAIAIVLLALLGVIGEALGYDRSRLANRDRDRARRQTFSPVLGAASRGGPRLTRRFAAHSASTRRRLIPLHPTPQRTKM